MHKFKQIDSSSVIVLKKLAGKKNARLYHNGFIFQFRSTYFSKKVGQTFKIFYCLSNRLESRCKVSIRKVEGEDSYFISSTSQHNHEKPPTEEVLVDDNVNSQQQLKKGKRCSLCCKVFKRTFKCSDCENDFCKSCLEKDNCDGEIEEEKDIIEEEEDGEEEEEAVKEDFFRTYEIYEPKNLSMETIEESYILNSHNVQIGIRFFPKQSTFDSFQSTMKKNLMRKSYFEDFRETYFDTDEEILRRNHILYKRVQKSDLEEEFFELKYYPDLLTTTTTEKEIEKCDHWEKSCLLRFGTYTSGIEFILGLFRKKGDNIDEKWEDEMEQQDYFDCRIYRFNEHKNLSLEYQRKNGEENEMFAWMMIQGNNIKIPYSLTLIFPFLQHQQELSKSMFCFESIFQHDIISSYNKNKLIMDDRDMEDFRNVWGFESSSSSSSSEEEEEEEVEEEQEKEEIKKDIIQKTSSSSSVILKIYCKYCGGEVPYEQIGITHKCSTRFELEFCLDFHRKPVNSFIPRHFQEFEEIKKQPELGPPQSDAFHGCDVGVAMTDGNCSTCNSNLRAVLLGQRTLNFH